MKFQSYDTYYLGAQRTKLYLRYWIPDQPKALVILVHGAGEHSGAFSHVAMKALLNQIAFIAPDLRGFGQSEGPRGHVSRFTEYLEDLDILIKLVKIDFQKTPLFLLGHSLGGLIAIRYVQEYSNHINGIILSSPAIALKKPLPKSINVLIELFSWLTPDLTVNPFRWYIHLKKISWLDPILPKGSMQMLNDPLANKLYTPRWLTELLHHGNHAMVKVANITQPTFCLCGKKDPIIDPKMIKSFVDAIPLQDKAYAEIIDGGHCPLYEPYQDQAINLIFRWVDHYL
ncbi:lysophospholipase [Tepidibacillus infernus]|uniref:Serine aminopeptidase S33 domain-containing protein n=1 Tax=Tepidibacillus decaturensis TaxID=1413211 RepID=A0A135L5G0_9BACI|nr:alpha/beta hydrolase [Tepidibacillus decaturensis]KXG44169.1 hypothetical protein U473_09270 [Tepidibacillus decaturensis]